MTGPLVNATVFRPTTMDGDVEWSDFDDFKQELAVKLKEVVLVAVDASRKITESAIEYAFSNVLKEGDKVVLLAILPSSNPSLQGWKLWGSSQCTTVSVGSEEDLKLLHLKCRRLMQQMLLKFDKTKKVSTSVRIFPHSERGIVAFEANRWKATWVIVDKNLKKEANDCFQKLRSNLVLVNEQAPRILRLNLKNANSIGYDESSMDSSSVLLEGLSLSMMPKGFHPLHVESVLNSAASSPRSTISSSPGLHTFSPSTSPVTDSDFEKRMIEHHPTRFQEKSSRSDSKADVRRLCQLSDLLATKDDLSSNMPSEDDYGTSHDLFTSSRTDTKADVRRLSLVTKDDLSSNIPSEDTSFDRMSSVRKEMQLMQHSPSRPPPLCSICQHKTPAFGKPPRKFSFRELQLATEDFSDANFLAQGGYGSVHRGLLPDGQAVAVKQYRSESTQGDNEFCSEVEVLSCAQHRNLVMLIGYCVEDNKRLLVYEFVCNGSLETHLHGSRSEVSVLPWPSRQKIAIGAARALRYLHEECRVGCIVHRDMRPNNILLTHDFEPMVGDFGLARWQPDGDLGVDTRVLGTFGYVAPEYAESGQITEKTDVYAFGVVLLVLVTGRKVIDMNRRRGQMSLMEWARQHLQHRDYEAMVDPRLRHRYSLAEAKTMLHVASLCIDPDPSVRPRMSQVLRLLEDDSDSVCPSPTSHTSSSSPGSNTTRVSRSKGRYLRSETVPTPKFGNQVPKDSHSADLPPRSHKRF